MPSRGIPVALYMWFSTGGSWAYHPTVQELLDDIIEKTNTYANHNRSKTEIGEIQFPEGLLLIHKRPDLECRDPKAVKRDPLLLLVAVIQGREPSSYTKEFISKHLPDLKLPEAQGPSESLVLQLPPELADFEDARTKLEDARTKLAKREEQVQRLEDQVRQLRDQNDSQEQEIGELKKENQKLTRSKETWDSDRGKLNQKIRSQQREVSRARIRLGLELVVATLALALIIWKWGELRRVFWPI